MKITYRDGIYIAISTYEERPVLKEAGFLFHPGLDECKAGPQTCPACKAQLGRGWWTKRAEAAARLSRRADQRATGQLSTHITAVKASRAMDAEIEIPVPEGRTLFGYQKAGVAFLVPRDRTLLADEMGTGKTIQTIGVINYDRSIKKVLVVCPAHLRTNWQKEAMNWLSKDERSWRFYIVDKDEPLPDDVNFVIANYNRITVEYRSCELCKGERQKPYPCTRCIGTGDEPGKKELCHLCNGKKTGRCEICKGRGKVPAINLKIAGSLMAQKWDILVLDEAHFIKNQTAARTRSIIGQPALRKEGLVHRSRKTIFITGSPMPNRPMELWPVCSICAPDQFRSYRAFLKRYCNAHEEFIGQGKKVLKVDGSSNLEELQEIMRSTFMIRRLKAEVLKDLPPKIRQIVPLMPTEKAKKLISEEKDIWQQKFGDELEIAKIAIVNAKEENDNATYSAIVERLKYIQKIAFQEMSRIRHEIAMAKVPSVMEHIDGMLKEGCNKIIVFAHHNDVIETLMNRWSDDTVGIYSKTKRNDRDEAIRKFQEDPRTKIFIGSIMAAGTGITLTASSNVVFAELDWTPANVTQSEDRAHRIGQKKSVLVQQLVIDGSLDARMAQMIVYKQNLADKALDKSTEVLDKMTLLDTQPEVVVLPVALWKKMLLKEAMMIIAQRRDPSTEGSKGFSAYDASFGQRLATWTKDYTDRQACLAMTLAKKYRRQLEEEIQKKLEIYIPPTAAEIHKSRFRKGAKSAATTEPQTFLDFINRTAT